MHCVRCTRIATIIDFDVIFDGPPPTILFAPARPFARLGGLCKFRIIIADARIGPTARAETRYIAREMLRKVGIEEKLLVYE